MSVLLMLAMMGKTNIPPVTVTRTFTATENFVVPAGVTVLSKIEGKGQDGQPSGYGPSSTQSINVASVTGATSGSGAIRSVRAWDYFTAHAYGMVNKVNTGGSGSEAAGYLIYVQYPDQTSTTTSSGAAWTDAVAGSALFTSTSWGFDGEISPGDQGMARVQYTRKGAFIPATTGLSASAFGKTFPGGAGGPATMTGYTSVPVTPGATYQVTVPTGGSVTITYQK